MILQFRDTAPMVVIAPHRWWFSWSLTQLKTLWIGGRLLDLIQSFPAPSGICGSFSIATLGLSSWGLRTVIDSSLVPSPGHSYLNYLALSWVGKEIVSDCRVMVSVFRFMQTIFVDRQSLESRRAAVAEIRRRTTGPGWPRWGPWWPRWWWWSWHWPPPITIMVIQKSAFWDQEGDYWTRVANYDIDYLCWMA